MPETATIPRTFEVPTDALVDAIAYFFHWKTGKAS
jgi:hypothetical protein